MATATASDIQALQQQIARLVQQVAESNTGMMEHLKQKDTENRAKIEQLEKMVSTMKTDRKSLVEQKSMAKMKNFKDNMSEWHAWSFKLTNLITSVFPEARDALEWASNTATV